MAAMTTEPTGPVTEHALLTVRPGQEAEFEAAFARAREEIRSSPGCRSVRLLRGHESPTTYLLLVEWDTLEAHTVDFRASAAFGRWRGLVSEFWEAPPAVQHLRAVEPPRAD